MAIKRKTREEETQLDMAIKKQARMEDRLTALPHDLQLHILTFLDTKDAFKTSLLSKSWASLWNKIPHLEFNYSVFLNLHVFDKFVNKLLSDRYSDRSANLDRLTFTRRGICSAKILNNVFGYAFSHGVKQLEAAIVNSRNHTWPDCNSPDASFESLTNLKLKSSVSMSCPFLWSRSGSFKNLTDLYLMRARIADRDPFSGFPMLEKLRLENCYFSEEIETLSIIARNLSDLTISSHRCFIGYFELTTPKLRFLEYQGYYFPQFKNHDGFTAVLDTIVVGYNGVYSQMQEKRMFEDLLSLFRSLPDAICLRLFLPIVDILSLFQNRLVKRSSPFRKLKCLEIDFGYPEYKNGYDRPWPFKSFIMPSTVETYLLQNFPDAKVTIIYPKC